jgi:predicted cupin superfamily sugar epimerase
VSPIDLRDAALPAEAVIAALRLSPHPEGGHFRETWRDMPPGDGRGTGTAILFLLANGQHSHWHRVDASELWIWQAGAPLALALAAQDGPAHSHILGQTLQHIVPPHEWQSAASLGAWSLVSCVVTPAFTFAGFEMAPPGWLPPAG